MVQHTSHVALVLLTCIHGWSQVETSCMTMSKVPTSS